MTHALETKRLLLRLPGAEDVPAMLAFFASERSRFYGGPMDKGAGWRKFAIYAGQWSLRGYGMFAICRRDTSETIGLAGPFHPEDFPEPEMSWLLTDASHEGQGYAREACEAVLQYLFRECGWSNVVSYIDPENTSSAALAARLGARPDPDAQVPIPGCKAVRHYPMDAANAAGDEAELSPESDLLRKVKV